jgi:hypothetical protein
MRLFVNSVSTVIVPSPPSAFARAGHVRVWQGRSGGNHWLVRTYLGDRRRVGQDIIQGVPKRGDASERHQDAVAPHELTGTRKTSGWVTAMPWHCV